MTAPTAPSQTPDAGLKASVPVLVALLLQIPQTAKIHASQPRIYETEEIKVTKNLAYGPHER